MNDIVEKENEKSSIEKLAAQKEIYSCAKKINTLQFFTSVVLIVILSFLQLFFKDNSFVDLLIAAFSIAIIFSDNFLENRICILKKKAAKIQELFDTYVLDIKWNQTLCHEKPVYEDIYKFFDSHRKKKDIEKLSNWYSPEIQALDKKSAKLVCQRTNCTYDKSVKLRYNWVIYSISTVSVILLLSILLFSGISAPKFILTFIIPIVPIIHWTKNNIKVNNDSIENLDSLYLLLSNNWDELKRGVIVDEFIFREIQDGIFLNRSNGPLIPDFIYYKLRTSLENQMHYTVEQLVKELNQALHNEENKNLLL